MRKRLNTCMGLLLLAVYLLATAGAACVSLSCRCVRMHVVSSEVASSHERTLLCGCCSASQDCRHGHAGALCWSAGCCCDHSHSTQVELYTLPDLARETALRCCEVALPASLAAVCPCPAHCEALRRRPPEPSVPLTEDPYISLAGLRAPPAGA